MLVCLQGPLQKPRVKNPKTWPGLQSSVRHYSASRFLQPADFPCKVVKTVTAPPRLIHQRCRALASVTNNGDKQPENLDLPPISGCMPRSHEAAATPAPHGIWRSLKARSHHLHIALQGPPLRTAQVTLPHPTVID
jgi:hypothetical protein